MSEAFQDLDIIYIINIFITNQNFSIQLYQFYLTSVVKVRPTVLCQKTTLLVKKKK